MMNIEIAGRRIGDKYPPYIVAELSANHNGDINKALRLIELAKENGADAIKIQTYTADTLTIKSGKTDFKISDGLWKGKTLYELYDWAHTPWEWHEAMFNKAKEVGITIFSSPFDNSAVDFLEGFDVPAYKIASFELVDLPLIAYVAKKGKPMIMSTGLANRQEIEEAVATARSNGCSELVLLHCVSGYPAQPEDYNLRTIPDMAKLFALPIGLSDHTLDNTTAITSVALGAVMIEKHFTLDRKGGGPDDSFSMEPQDLKHLCESSRITWGALGKVNYEPTEAETKNIIFRRSLYVVKPVKQGEAFTRENIRSIRPGYGLPPKYLSELLGRKAAKDIEMGTRLSWDLVQ